MKRADAALLLLGGCSLEPHYVRPVPAVPTALPSAEAAAPLDRAAVFRDPRLQGLIARALATNQNLRVALANVEAARGLYRVQRAALLPTLGVSGGVTVADRGTAQSNTSGGGANTGTATGSAGRGGQTTQFSADIGVSAFELDLFGRVRSLTRAQLDTYLASDAGARAARVTLVADVADAWLTLATDRSLLAIARDTRTSAARSVTLTQARLRGGVAPRTDLRQAETVLATADNDLANLTTLVTQDRHALDLLAGAPVTDADLPASIEEGDAGVVAFGAGLESGVLLRRPDVVQAEYLLRAANARIGAARAAFFPRLSLTGLAGFASGGLSALFSGGAFTYSAGPAIALPLFDGGAARGNLAYARAQFDAATASYQFAIQSAFRDVADALARKRNIAAQADAATRLEAAARDSAFLADARYRGGVDTFLASLDAQRTLYAARRTLASTRLVRAQNVVALYRALGGDQALDPQPR